MRRKSIAKLGAPILALGLISACGNVNDSNDNTPQETNDTPQDVNYQQDQEPNNNNSRNNNDKVNESDMRNNDNTNAPENEKHPSIDRNDKGAGPKHGSEPTKNLQQ